MTKKETVGIISIIVNNYPNFGANGDDQVILNLWHKAFENLPYQMVLESVTEYCISNEYQPNPARIRKLIYQKVKPETMSFETIRYWLDWCIENGNYSLGGRSYREAYYQTPLEFRELVSLADVMEYANSNEFYAQRLLERLRQEHQEVEKAREVKFLTSQEPLKLIHEYELLEMLLENYN